LEPKRKTRHRRPGTFMEEKKEQTRHKKAAPKRKSSKVKQRSGIGEVNYQLSQKKNTRRAQGHKKKNERTKGQDKQKKLRNRPRKSWAPREQTQERYKPGKEKKKADQAEAGTKLRDPGTKAQMRWGSLENQKKRKFRGIEWGKHTRTKRIRKTK